MTVINLHSMADLKRKPLLSLPTPAIVDVLLDTQGRARVVDHVVNIARELPSRADRIDYWLEIVRRYRTQAIKEKTERELIARALDLLARDVKSENARRHQRCLDAARIDPPLFDFEPTGGGQIVRFPGDEDITMDELMMPPQFRR